MSIDSGDVRVIVERLTMVGYKPTKEFEKTVEKTLKAGDRAAFQPESPLYKAYLVFIRAGEDFTEHSTNSLYSGRLRESWETFVTLAEQDEAAHASEHHRHTPPPIPGATPHPAAHADTVHTEAPRPSEKPRRSNGVLFQWMVLVPLLVLVSFLLGRYVWPSMSMVAKKADAQCTAKITAAKTTWEEACQSLQSDAYSEGQKYVYRNLAEKGLKARPRVVIDNN
jgi:hypothetical protein